MRFLAHVIGFLLAASLPVAARASDEPSKPPPIPALSSDAATPLCLSDGQQTLLYDLSGNRVVRVPTSRAYVNIGWDPKKPMPLGFDVGVDFNPNPKGLARVASTFRVDRFVAAAGESLKRLDGGKNTL